jgi:hypothetical protein
MKWVEHRLRWCATDQHGRVVGEITKSGHIDPEYYAVCNGKHLGMYLKLSDAQRAVERAYEGPSAKLSLIEAMDRFLDEGGGVR